MSTILFIIYLSYGYVCMPECSYVYPYMQCLYKTEDSLRPLEMGVLGGCERAGSLEKWTLVL